MSETVKIEMVEQLEPFSDSPWFGVRVNDKKEYMKGNSSVGQLSQ